VPILRRTLASVLAWTVGAVAAVGVGLLALSLIGDGLSTRAGQPLTPDAVAREASTLPTGVAPSGSTPSGSGPAEPESPPGNTPSNAPASTVPAAPPTPAAHPVDRLITSRGGSAIARCTGDTAYLVSWSPEPGYRYDNLDRGPATEVRVRFRAGEIRVRVSVTCVAGVPKGHIEVDT
jgi:hypothetical protein